MKKGWPLRLLKRVLAVCLPLLILGACAYAANALFASAPETQRVTERRLPPLVEVVPVEQRPMPRLVEANGNVMPAQSVSLSTEVTGRVIEMHPSLEPGGIIHAGEVLIRLDPEEYKLAHAQAKAAHAEAVAALEVEQGRQRVAQREWELFGKELPEAELGKDLVLRGPQLNQAKARIASAQSAVDRAALDIKRTEIRVPFDALVVAESVEIGQHLSPGDSVASLAGTAAFWIQASVSVAQLGVLLDNAQKPDAVRVFSDLHTLETEAIPGRLVRHLGQVDTIGHMAQVLIEVADPLALLEESAGRQPLPLNTFATVELDAGTVEGAVPLPSHALRENAELWVADASNLLQVRTTKIVWQTPETVAVQDVFEPGDRVIVSPLEQALPGMEVRFLPGASEGAAASEPETGHE